MMRLDRPAHVFSVEEIKDEKLWYFDIKCFLQSQIYPPGASLKDKKTLRRLAYNFYLSGDILYKRNFDMVLLRCGDRHESDLLMAEVHEGSFGTHSNGHAMAKKMSRAGYYWLTMESDCCKFVKKCHKCQIYADKIHVPLTLLNVISSPWPFSIWGINMIGMIEPKASNGHRFILVAIDYFTKWVEAASYANVTKQVVVRDLTLHCKQAMASRKTIWINLVAISPQLKNLVSELPDHAQFIKKHDYQLVPTLEEFSRLLGIPILDQTPFSGLEKIPKSEEVAVALHMTKSDIETNWVTRSGVKGLLSNF
ncbi:hypothetical protein KIW84_073234 [Lathyrus oleraceus]|uniref:Gypsy retrotransposon integrase-like protein 1 n=1 Tax=Pisum sativum TaxID=3888 RepID=A0A9D4ZYP2_PEA|nr:hypothetical protein KIW84_073234 [Pisum sativum]